MKKNLLLIVFALVAAIAQAQEVNYNPFHYMGYDLFMIENMLQQRDGDIVTCTYVAVAESSFSEPRSVGDIIHKISPNTLQFTDSLFLADTVPPYYLFARDPHGEGNIRANFEYDENRDSTFLRISHFMDDSLNVDNDGDIMTPVCEGPVMEYIDSYMVDCRDDLIMKYYKEMPDGSYEGHITRFDSDGTLKHEALLPEEQNNLRKMKVFSESPLTYYHWKRSMDSNLTCYVLDSAFRPKVSSIINKILKEENIGGGAVAYEYLDFRSDTQVVADGEDILIAAKYVNDTNFNPITSEHGIAVARYDLRTMVRKNLITFNEWTGQDTEATCFGLQKMSDGALYLLYSEMNPEYQQMTFAVKMDPDFNVEWKRFFKISEKVELFSTAHCIPATDNEGNEVMAITGDCIDIQNNQIGMFYFFLTHDGTVGVNEGGIEVRPYIYYPNPVKEQLQMQFSPDVQPAQVELYDLQGRLVGAQNKAFESLDMSRLPTGTYSMRVTLENGKVYSNKVVKQ
jgi:hypothetical protein